MSPGGRPPSPSEGGVGLFPSLGRAIVRRPYVPIAFWIVLLLLALPLLGSIGSATQSSATNLPSGAPSEVAQSELARLFPNASGGSSSIILLEGANVSGPVGQAATLRLVDAIEADPSITHLEGVETLYGAYAEALDGTARIGLPIVAASNPGGPEFALVNGSAQALWGTPARFLTTWQGLVAAHPGSPAGSWNALALNETLSSPSPPAAQQALLEAFYGGPGEGGWNGSANCAAAPATAAACADTIVRGLPATLLQAAVGATGAPLLPAVLGGVGLESLTDRSLLGNLSIGLLLEGSSLPMSWVVELRSSFPSGTASPLALATYCDAIAWNSSVARYPIPVPSAIASRFVDPAGDAMIVVVDFDVPDSFTTPSGGQPIVDDVAAIDRIVASEFPPGGPITALETGPAALDAQEMGDLGRDLAIVLPLTLLVLVGITILYFRAPLAPILTFGGLGLALALSFAAIVLVGRFLTKVDPTALTLSTTFVLGVGTDYSIFLVARYREEILRGTPHREAVVTSVSWAGVSIATSGATATLATLALAFSGVALLSQWGIVLSISILLTLLVSLTLVPAALTLLGERLFWPTTGRRLGELAERERTRVEGRRSYFDRAARLGARRPARIVALVLVASIPLVAIALTVPVSYDFYAQLPQGEPASDGLPALEHAFGGGAAFPSFVLVTFRSPILAGTSTNASEFTDLAQITEAINETPGVASVASPVGPSGASLSDWLAYGNASPVERALLLPVLLPSLGSDNRTILLTFSPSSSGLSLASVELVGTVRGELSDFASAHPEVVGLAFGGGAQTTADLQAATAAATLRMVVAVTIGLVIVLLAVLRSWIIPLLAVATIGLSISWAWAVSYLVVGVGLAQPIFYFVPTVLFILILGLGIDYNIFLLTRVREERLRGRGSSEAAVEAVARTGGIITAAAIILASAFAVLISGRFLLLQTIGFAVAVAIVLDAMIVRTYLVPSTLHLLGDRVWPKGRGGAPREGD